MINERIRELRTTLGLNQRDFSAKSKIGHSTLAMFETGQRVPKDIHISQICQAFNVNEEWLRSGKGEMFKRDDDAAATQLAREFSLSTLGQAIIKSYLHLGEPEKAVIGEYIKSVAQEYERADTVRISGDESIDPEIRKELDSYRQELEQEKSTQTSSVSQDTGKDVV